MDELLHNQHPGKLLLNDFMKPTGTDFLTINEATDIPLERLKAITDGKTEISEHVDEKLCKFFSLSQGYFLRLQQFYIDEKERRK